jgi:prophage antirepressor-like protein
MQYSLQIFETEDHQDFRTLNIDGEPWFVVADICRALDLKPKNGSFYHHAVDLDPDERRLVARSIIDNGPSHLKGEGVAGAPIGASLLMTNESGLYSLVLNSKKPEAKRFKKWITSEVLPALRRTGVYGLRPSVPAFIARYNANWDRLTPGYFSIISELVIRLWGRLEKEGHIMADFAEDGTENRPDVSVGRLFSKWLKENRPEVSDNYSYYYHWTDAGEFAASSSTPFGFRNMRHPTSKPATRRRSPIFHNYCRPRGEQSLRFPSDRERPRRLDFSRARRP